MGRFVTIMATNVSRQAQRLPLTAPSGPDCGRLTSADYCSRHFVVDETYSEDGHGVDRACEHDEYCTAEEDHQGQSASKRNVHTPK